jgi:hypothetical protein
MLAVVDEARVLAGEAHAAWSESFNEMFAQAAGAFANAAVAGTGGPICWACCRRLSGRTGGRWRSSPGMCRRMGCSGC